MPHIDDGHLHAYLDGALDHLGRDTSARVREHLDSCASCRQRLEDERRVRDDAASVLQASGPDTPEMPPFEEIRRRAQAAPAPTPPTTVRRGPPRGWGLAWAASVVLALGLGWAGRGLGWRGAELSVAEPAFSEAPATAPDAASGVADDGVAAPAEASVRNEAGGEAVLDEAEAFESRPQTRPEDDPEGNRTLGAATPVSPDVDEASAPTGRRADLASEVEEPARRLAPAGLERDQVAAAPALVMDSVAAQSEKAGATDSTVAAREVELEEQARFRRTRDEAQVADADARDNEEDATQDALAVPGLEVLAVRLDGEDVVVDQRLPDGTPLEVRYTRTAPADLLFRQDARASTEQRAAAPAAAPFADADPGVRRVVRARGDGWLVLAAMADSATLARWLATIP